MSEVVFASPRTSAKIDEYPPEKVMIWIGFPGATAVGSVVQL